MEPFRSYVAMVLLTVVPLVGGCTTYYKVHDPTTGKSYYTTKVTEKSGATVLTDARTGSKVTIQNSEISTVSKSEYDKARAAK